ncbi:MAG: T9SS type A sorting domain-containing protein [Flavobacteriales bacterium]
MKHITLGALLLLSSASVNAQLFTSDLEAWTDGLPDDFVGTRTNLSTDSIFQETEDVHGGTYAVRLQLSTGTHKRFTTAPQSVTAGVTYDITFWVRGTGSIRTGLYDGRPDASGYSAYNAYVDLLDADWQEVTQSVTAAVTTAEAEFVFSILETVGPSHLVLDDITISEGAVVEPTTATIYEIQFTTDVAGASPLVNQPVVTSGVVTASKAGLGYFLQDGTGPWNGIFVNDATNTPSLGDLVELTASVQENFGFTRLNNVVNYAVTSSGNTVPAAELLNPTTASQEQWESVLVTVSDVECTVLPNNFGEWTIANWLGSMLADDVLFVATPTLGSFYTITGPIQYAFSTWRILPRDLNDIGVGTSVSETNGTIFGTYPNPANDLLFIELDALNGRTEYSLIDPAGRVVLSDVATSDRVQIPTGGLSNGVYLLTVRNSAGASSTRVAVQH